MYYGEMTEEQTVLYREYEVEFGYSPDGVEQLEYTNENYDQYVSDIKRSLKLHMHIVDLYPQTDLPTQI
jgi:hypothetical protein